MLFTFRVRAHPGTWGFAAVTADEALLTFGETNQRIAWVVRPGNYPVLETRVSDLSQAVSSLLVPITLLTLAEFNSLGATAASVYADSSPGNAGGWAERWFGMFIQRIIPDSSMTSFPAVAGDIIAPIDITMGLNDIMSGISQQLALQKDTDTKAYVLYNILTSKDPEEWGFAIIPVRKTLSLEETKVQPVLELRPKSFPMVPVQKTLLSQLTRQADYRLVAVKVLTQTEWALLDFLVANALTKAGPMDQPGWAARWYSSFLTEVNAKPIRSSNRPMKRALSDKSIIPYPKIALATQAEIILDVKSEMDGVSEQLQASDGKPVLDPRRLVLFAYLAIEKPNEEWGFALVPAGPNLNARATAEQIIKVMGPENREARVGDTALAELAARTNSLLIPVKVLSSEESVSYAQWLQRTITAAGRQDATWASRWYTAVLRELRVPLFPLAADHHASLLPRASPQPPYPQPRPSKSPKPQKTTSAAFATERRRAGAAAADDGLLARAARGTAR
ncbi:MAG: hypothetical protein M1829_005561 [Trizodia sp. TS-e1964]|nr:MAG: hypothetical protein M1829_005561 [Trizodia sp. TS-e1964]